MNRVLLAVAEPVFRTGLAMMVDAADDLVLLAEAADMDAVRAAMTSGPPQVLLLDLHLPGLDLPRQIPDLARATTVVALAKHADEDRVDAALLAGAAAFVVRSSAPEEILAALHP